MEDQTQIFRVKQVCERKQISLEQLAAKIWNDRLKKVGITYHSLYARISGNMSFSKLKEIADALGTEPAELIETGEGYAHFYDDKTGEWLGIRKK